MKHEHTSDESPFDEFFHLHPDASEPDDEEEQDYQDDQPSE